MMIDDATRARWIAGTLGHDGHSIVHPISLSFGGAATDATGFARVERLTAEDGAVVSALWTHPRWAGRGTIKGFWPWQRLPAGAVFSARVGFRHGATTSDGVTFQVWAHYRIGAEEKWTRVVNLPKRVTGALVEVRADLSWLGGSECQLELRVDAGASSERDWAIWVDPRITTRTGPVATGWRLRPTSIHIDRAAPGPSGDDPALAMIYFRTTLGHRGSSTVVVQTKLLEVATDRGTGATIAIGANAALEVHDVMVPWSASDLLTIDGAALAGLIVIGVERDLVGDGAVRDAVAKVARALLTSLRANLEPLTMAALLASPALLPAAVAAVEADVGKVLASNSGDGDGPGHDVIGNNRITLLGLDTGAFTAAAALVNDPNFVLDPDRAVGPIAPLVPRRFHLTLAGDGSRWTVDVTLETLALPATLAAGIG